MRAALLLGLLILFQTHLGDLGLPPQPDLDLPIVLGHYDPLNPPPAPPPPSPVVDDPRDEPPPVFFGEEIESENDSICYVIDCSGSMRRFGRLDRAKEELRRSVGALTPNVRFNVIAYSCSVSSWRPATVEATPENKAQALQWVDALEAGGGTATGPATALALADGQCLAFVLLTDGAPSCGAYPDAEAHRRMILNANEQHATINVFGVDARGDWRVFCQNVARDSGGSYYDVPVGTTP